MNSSLQSEPAWRCEAAIDECFLLIQIAFVVESLREDFEDGPQHAGRGPTAETAGGRFDATDSGPAGLPMGHRRGCH